MPGQPTSDAAFDLHRVCQHGIQFTYGIDLYLPGSGRQPPDSEPPPRFQRIQVAHPPPDRASNVGRRAWYDGIYVDPDPTDNQATLESALGGGDWRGQDLFYLPDLFSLYQEGIASLGVPAENTIVLDKQLTIPFVHTLAAPAGEAQAARPEMFMALGPPLPQDRLGFLSVPYPQASPGQVEVNYKATLTCRWKTGPELEVGDWIAVSFDQFTPPERSSADYIAQIRACTEDPCQILVMTADPLLVQQSTSQQ
jgi:hypothetical protein